MQLYLLRNVMNTDTKKVKTFLAIPHSRMLKEFIQNEGHCSCTLPPEFMPAMGWVQLMPRVQLSASSRHTCDFLCYAFPPPPKLYFTSFVVEERIQAVP